MDEVLDALRVGVHDRLWERLCDLSVVLEGENIRDNLGRSEFFIEAEGCAEHAGRGRNCLARRVIVRYGCDGVDVSFTWLGRRDIKHGNLYRCARCRFGYADPGFLDKLDCVVVRFFCVSAVELDGEGWLDG